MCQPPASFVQLCGPVKDDGHGLGLCLFHLCVNQEALPVAAHVIDEQFRAGGSLPGVAGKRATGVPDRSWRPLSPAGHHFAVRGKVKQLFAVPSPPGLLSSSC